jgi:hypothetical protein
LLLSLRSLLQLHQVLLLLAGAQQLVLLLDE